MYSFEPTEEQKMLVDAVHKYAAKDLREAAHEADESGGFPEALISKGWELGVVQASVPEAFGGFGDHSTVTGALAAEELAWGDLAGALTILGPGVLAFPLLLAGTEEQKKKYLPPLVGGGYRPVSLAWVEPRFDFDPGELRSTARLENGGFVLDGHKCFVPFAHQAESFLVFASLEGKTQAFLLPRQTQGLTVLEREGNLGIRALPTFEIKLDNCRLPAEARLGGREGHDPGLLLHSTHVALAAMAIGVARAAYEYAMNYAKERVQFGVPIAQKQVIAFMLAEMATEIEAARLLVWEAAWTLDQGQEATRAVTLAKTAADDTVMSVTDRAVQILGGHGYIREHPVEMWMRNGRGFPTFTGLAMV
ncbi:MAG: acyl-CoA dehydrogenase family protein [Anaerolineales bacterium]|jgi:alkylation response protein AidB-like acyl-CoA dehydrogenase